MLAKILCTIDVDLVHALNVDALTCTVANIIRRLILGENVKIVKHVYLIPYKYPYTKKVLYKQYLNIFNGLIATSKYIYRWLVKNLGLKAYKIHVVPPPINCEIYRPLQHKRSISNKNQEKVILYLGPLYPERFPVNEVLQGLKIVSNHGYNVKLLIIARGWPCDKLWMKYIKRMAHQLRLKVEVSARYLDVKERVLLFNKVDAVLYPCRMPINVVDPPISILEAMSCGNIVVATKVQSIPEIIIDGKNGVLIDSMSPKDIAQAIEKALDTKTQEEIRINARKTIIKRFHRNIVAKMLLRIYKKLCSTN